MAARVLVVDDDASAREHLTGLLESAGYSVATAADGREGLEKAGFLRPEIVLTDSEMPVLDGVALCRLVKANETLQRTHLIFVSSRGETEAKVRALDVGADDYLVKPVEPSELLARVRAGLRLHTALTELASKNELLSRLALTDSLTELANRRAFEESLGAELARSLRHCRPLSLLYLDLDHFKRVNDAHGHAVGDEVLTDFAALLKRLARRGDLAARIGGEEFAVVLPHTGLDQAQIVADRIRKAVEEQPLGRTAKIPMTVSIGAATFAGSSAHDRHTFLIAADSALYRAKTEGRNRVAVAED